LAELFVLFVYLVRKINTTKTNRQTAGPVTSETQRIARPGAETGKPEEKSTFRPWSDDLLEEAEQESNHLDLDEYWQVIAPSPEIHFETSTSPAQCRVELIG